MTYSLDDSWSVTKSSMLRLVPLDSLITMNQLAAADGITRAGYEADFPLDPDADFPLMIDENAHAFSVVANDEILLDNCSSVDIFHNVNLLSNLHSVIAKKVHGVEEGGCGITITQAGSFGVFGDNIGFHPNATANILFQARLIEEGFDVTYNKAADSFTVTSQRDCTRIRFSMRVKPNGKL